MKALLTTQLIESQELGAFQYQRLSFFSAILKREMTYGLLRLKDVSEIEGTIYVFHGANGDDRQTIEADLPQKISPPVLARLHKMKAQLVLPLVHGSFLHESPADQSTSYFDYFKKEIIPLAENETSSQSQSRYLVGYSAGGQGALSAFLKEPTQYKGVGAHFPIFSTFNYESIESINEYVVRTRANKKHVDVAVQCFKAIYLNAEDLERENPLQLLKRLPTGALHNKRVYFDVGTEDEFGLHEGCGRFHDSLSTLGIPHVFELVKGGKHDAAFLQSRFSILLQSLMATDSEAAGFLS